MDLPFSENVRCILFSETRNIRFVFSMSFIVYETFDMNTYVTKRVIDPFKHLISGQKNDKLLIMIAISMCAITLNKFCLLLLDTFLGNTMCVFSKSFSVLALIFFIFFTTLIRDYLSKHLQSNENIICCTLATCRSVLVVNSKTNKPHLK